MMYSLMKPVGLILFFIGVLLMIYMLIPRQKRLDLSGKGPESDFDVEEDSKFVLMFKPFYQLFEPFIEWLPVHDYKAKMKKYVITAGIERNVTPNDMIGFQISVMVVFTICALIVFDSLVYISLIAAIGLIYPYLWLYEKKKQRQDRIRVSMPDIVDMLSLSVEAGLAFNAAVQKVCDIYKKDKDPFVVELYLMDQNIKLGRSREEALKIMAERVDLIELDSFCSILIQANQMGSSIADVLKSQADRMRSERFMKAEKMGAQASQKLLFPMMIFIFPLIFIVIFGPYLIKYILGS